MSDAALAPKRARILLVDDNHDVRTSMRRALAQAGHNVVEAGSGEAAAAVIRKAVPFDLLVLAQGVGIRDSHHRPGAARGRRRHRGALGGNDGGLVQEAP